MIIWEGPPPHRTMKVRVTVTVEVDRDAWELAYGTASAADIRDDVKAQFLQYPFAPDSGAEVIDAR